jgi:hypothetical protein
MPSLSTFTFGDGTQAKARYPFTGAFPFCWFSVSTVAGSGWTGVTPLARAWRNAGQLQEVAWII